MGDVDQLGWVVIKSHVCDSQIPFAVEVKKLAVDFVQHRKKWHNIQMSQKPMQFKELVGIDHHEDFSGYPRYPLQ